MAGIYKLEYSSVSNTETETLVTLSPYVVASLSNISSWTAGNVNVLYKFSLTSQGPFSSTGQTVYIDVYKNGSFSESITVSTNIYNPITYQYATTQTTVDGFSVSFGIDEEVLITDDVEIRVQRIDTLSEGEMKYGSNPVHKVIFNDGTNHIVYHEQMSTPPTPTKTAGGGTDTYIYWSYTNPSGAPANGNVMAQINSDGYITDDTSVAPGGSVASNNFNTAVWTGLTDGDYTTTAKWKGAGSLDLIESATATSASVNITTLTAPNTPSISNVVFYSSYTSNSTTFSKYQWRVNNPGTNGTVTLHSKWSNDGFSSQSCASGTYKTFIAGSFKEKGTYQSIFAYASNAAGNSSTDIEPNVYVSG